MAGLFPLVDRQASGPGAGPCLDLAIVGLGKGAVGGIAQRAQVKPQVLGGDVIGVPALLALVGQYPRHAHGLVLAGHAALDTVRAVTRLLLGSCHRLTLIIRCIASLSKGP